MDTSTDKTKQFIIDVAEATKKHVVDFAKGMWQHLESVAILTLSSLGLAQLLAEIPFYVTLPFWVETPLVIPVAAVFMILGLVKLAEHRANKRNAPVLAMV